MLLVDFISLAIPPFLRRLLDEFLRVLESPIVLKSSFTLPLLVDALNIVECEVSTPYLFVGRFEVAVKLATCSLFLKDCLFVDYELTFLLAAALDCFFFI